MDLTTFPAALIATLAAARLVGWWQAWDMRRAGAERVVR